MTLATFINGRTALCLFVASSCVPDIGRRPHLGPAVGGGAGTGGKVEITGGTTSTGGSEGGQRGPDASSGESGSAGHSMSGGEGGEGGEGGDEGASSGSNQGGAVAAAGGHPAAGGAGGVGGAGGSSEGGAAATTGGLADTGGSAGSGSSGNGGVSAGNGGSQSSAGSAAANEPELADWPMPHPPSSGLPNPQSYDTSVPGVVVDLVTDLMWQRALAPGSYTYGGAAAPCEALTLAGHDDWRLPTAIELVSLADPSTEFPAIDTVVFPATPTNDACWASTLAVGWSARAQTVSFAYGNLSDSAFSTPNRVRCVRATRARSVTPRYTVQNGSVADSRTGLSWQAGIDPTPQSRAQALAYCTSLSLDGAGWRVPSVKELATIIDFTQVSPALDTALFGGGVNDKVWTSTLQSSNTALGHVVDFSTGASLQYDIVTPALARCVR